ncbi:uncharacterized protein LOC110650809 [Hevea brasiliensis]|uniref:uncharacterized protein LOC110650809 n=1 Tax=Hevea brasiliensis TaxID=3981 RepID=UPI0025E1326E|nr:uncharacterized protein LOC110650809 [Hevea brasiliensis]
MDLIKYVFKSPFIPGRIAKWQVILSQYDITYMKKKVVKGSVIADLLAENPIDDYEAPDFEFPDEYINAVSEDTEGQDDVSKMYFDGAVNLSSNGIGAILISPEEKHFLIAVKLKFECANNVVEYEAYGEWQTRDSKLISYQKYLLEQIKEFEEISFIHLTHDKNQFADALAALGINNQQVISSLTRGNTEKPKRALQAKREKRGRKPARALPAK